MANYFVRSGAAGSATGADWPNAWTNLKAAEGVAAGSVIYVAHDHNYASYGATVTMGFATAASAMVTIACVNDATASSNYANANTPAASTIVTTPTAIEYGNGYALTVNGNVFVQGMYFKSTYATSIAQNGADVMQRWRNCKFESISTSARTMSVGADGASASQRVYWENVDVVLGNNAGSILYFAAGDILWRGGTFTPTTTQPTNAIALSNRCAGRYLLEAVDFSAMSNTVVRSSGDSSNRIVVSRCKKHSTAAVSSFAATEYGSVSEQYACGSSGTLVESALLIDSAFATSTSTVSIYRDGGATDDGGTTNFSVSVKAKASSGISLGKTHRFKLGTVWWDNTKTNIRVYVAQKSGQTRLTDAQAWVEASWVRDGDPLAGFANSKAADYGPLTTGTTWTTDSGSAWTGLTSEVMSYADIAPTDDANGPLEVYFVLAADNSATDAEYFVCPKVELIA